MKKLLNTLFVSTQGAYLNKEGQSVLVNVDREVRLRVPIHTIGGIVCFGQVTCSAPLMGFCAENKVEISFLSEHDQFRGRVQGPSSGNVLLRRQQYRLTDDPKRSAEIASWIVCAKLANARTVLQRALRDHGDKAGSSDLERVADRLRQYIRKARESSDLDVIRGYEGEGAQVYFSVFDHLISSQKEDFQFTKRSRRPPMDEINALISFLYTLLVHDLSSACESIGLDRAVGYLHRERPGRPAMALDLMEEFRCFLADRLALSLVNLKQVQKKGFTRTESGGVVMDDDTRKTLLVAYQKRKQEEIQHPFTGEKIAIGLIFHIQALLMARYIRGDLDAYPPFVWK